MRVGFNDIDVKYPLTIVRNFPVNDLHLWMTFKRGHLEKNIVRRAELSITDSFLEPLTVYLLFTSGAPIIRCQLKW